MKFNHLNLPDHWQHYWTKYPEGYTILEALISWVSQVDDMVDNVNDWNVYLNTFVDTFDTNLSETVGSYLTEWSQSGFLEDLLNQYTNDRVDDLYFRKIDKGNVKVDDINLNYGKISLSYLDDTVISAMSGQTPVAFDLADGAVTRPKLYRQSVTSDKTNFAYENVLNPALTESLKVFNPDGTLSDSSEGYFISHPIETDDTQDWYFKRARVNQLVAQYDINDNLLSFGYGNGTTGSDEPYLYQPRNPEIHHFRVAFSRWLDTPDSFWIIRGAELPPTNALPYGITIPNLNTSDSLKNKRVLFVGDSITAADGTNPSYAGETVVGFQEQFRLLGADVTNYAIAGATYRKYDDTISDSSHGSLYTQIITLNAWDFSGFDYIYLLGGTNDVGRGPNFGTVDSRDSSTTYGALNLIIEKIQTDNPTAKIILCTPPQRKREGTTHVPDLWSKLVELSEGILNIGADYGVKTKNLLKNGGIGKGNIDTALYDVVHPNNIGHYQLGTYLLFDY